MSKAKNTKKTRQAIRDAVVNLVTNNPGILDTYLNENAIALMNIHKCSADEAVEIMMNIRLSSDVGVFNSEEDMNKHLDALAELNRK